MAWLRRNFARLDEDSTKVKRERHARAYILQIIGGILMPDKSQNVVHLRWLPKLVDFREAGKLSWGSTVLATFHIELPTELQDIRLLLDQRLEANFEWTPYEDPAIQKVIPEEFFVNPNTWHVKVSLVVYATVQMHETDRAMTVPLKSKGWRDGFIISANTRTSTDAHTTHRSDLCFTKLGHLPNHLFLDRTMHNDNGECKNRNAIFGLRCNDLLGNNLNRALDTGDYIRSSGTDGNTCFH
ncbi:hypothetical protein Golax_025343, partial [Gossypium laxum]|nr:hypothetical protein [Gossypium laxum]